METKIKHMPLSENPFEKIWDDFFKVNKNIAELIVSRIIERNDCLTLIKKYVDYLQDERVVNILEIGCGTAIDSYYLAEHTSASVWAIDKSVKAIQVAEEIGKHFAKKINLIVCDVTRTNFEDGFFNLIFSQGVIEHFHNAMPVMREQVRILHDEGYLIVDVPQKYNIYTIMRKVLTKMGRWPYGWERGYSIGELRVLGKHAGLKAINAIGWGLTEELGRSKKPYIANFWKLYNVLMRMILKIFPKFSIYLLQNICVVFKKDRTFKQNGIS